MAAPDLTPRPPSCVGLITVLHWFLALALAGIRPSAATEAFAYVWRQGPVTVRWSEGNGGAQDAAVRGLVGHWKRLAVSAWAPSRVPLHVEVSLYGPEMEADRLTCDSPRADARKKP